jgi:hypothetical protein
MTFGAFVLGLIIGGPIGYLLCALLITNREADEYERRNANHE